MSYLHELENVEQSIIPFLIETATNNPIVVETITDRNMFWVTIIAGGITAAATFAAVLFTHIMTSRQFKKTMEVNEQRYHAELERYKADKVRQENEKALAIVKPSLKYAAFSQLREKLILDGNEERVLLLSSKEGFAFYDDEKHSRDLHCIFSLCNESENPIQFLNIKVSSTIKNESNHATEIYEFENVVKLLRRNESILLRIHNVEQRNMLIKSLNEKQTITTDFACIINYLTLANQQICYEYSIKITEIPKYDEKSKQVRSERKTEIIKDEYRTLDEITIDINKTASYFRDLQENLRADRFGYRFRKIGEEQMKGTMDALSQLWEEKKMDERMANAYKAATDINNSVKDVASKLDSQQAFFEEFLPWARSQQSTGKLEDKTNAEVIEADET